MAKKTDNDISKSIAKSLIIACLIACALWSTPKALAGETDGLILDEETLKFCMMTRPKIPAGLIVFHIIDSETRLEIDSVGLFFKRDLSKFLGPLKQPPSLWCNQEFLAFKFTHNGYVSVVIDGFKAPVDSLLIVTLQMKKGEGTNRTSLLSGESVAFVSTSLDCLFPKNEIMGRVIDASSGNTISTASVYCEETDYKVLTNGLGEFVIGLGNLNSVNLNIWHPMYDSIRFEVNKRYIRTRKEIEIHFQAPRKTVWEILKSSQNKVLLLVDMFGWSSGNMLPHENKHKISTYLVRPGDNFGPFSRKFHSDNIPFRFIRRLRDNSIMVKFTRDFRRADRAKFGDIQFAFLSDSTIKFNSNSYDAGNTISLSLQADYFDEGTADISGRKKYVTSKSGERITPCNVIKAEVEQIHMVNMFSLAAGDSIRFTKSLSNAYSKRKNGQSIPFDELFGNFIDSNKSNWPIGSKLAKAYEFNSPAIYIHGGCDKPPNERFLEGCKQSDFIPQDGDVYIYFPGTRSGWGAGFSTVYRQLRGNWKIVAMF